MVFSQRKEAPAKKSRVSPSGRPAVPVIRLAENRCHCFCSTVETKA